MTEAETRLLDELAEPAPTTHQVRPRHDAQLGSHHTRPRSHRRRRHRHLDRVHPLYVRADHPALTSYYARIAAEGREPEPDDPDALRRRASLDWAATTPT